MWQRGSQDALNPFSEGLHRNPETGTTIDPNSPPERALARFGAVLAAKDGIERRRVGRSHTNPATERI